jgi:hypothetical protein
MVQHYKAATVKRTKSICLCGAGGGWKNYANEIRRLVPDDTRPFYRVHCSNR